MSSDQFTTLKKKKLPLAGRIEQVDANFIIYSLIPSSARQTWQIELFDAAREIPSHYHKIQTQILMILEGEVKLTTFFGEEILKPEQMVVIPPNISHMIMPLSRALFISVNIPGFDFPEDVYNSIVPNQKIRSNISVSPLLNKRTVVNIHNNINPIFLKELKTITNLPEDNYVVKTENEGYDAYLLTKDYIYNKWSIAILDINETPEHFHKIGREHFIVLNGILKIKVEGVNYYLKVGDSIHIPPALKHHLKSAIDTPVRVLCINFPAFDEKDFFIK